MKPIPFYNCCKPAPAALLLWLHKLKQIKRDYTDSGPCDKNFSLFDWDLDDDRAQCECELYLRQDEKTAQANNADTFVHSRR